jgi:hypothetical protein
VPDDENGDSRHKTRVAVASPVAVLADRDSIASTVHQTCRQKEASKIAIAICTTNQSESNGLSLARTSSSTLVEALQMNRDPRCSQEALRN